MDEFLGDARSGSNGISFSESIEQGREAAGEPDEEQAEAGA
jgi:hypothetical protein